MADSKKIKLGKTVREIPMPVTRKFAEMTPRELFEYDLNHKIESCERQLDKWGEDFANDPMYSLEWSDKAFEAAADLYVLKMLRLHVAEGDFASGLDDFLKRAAEETLRAAKWPSRSTSPCTNHAKQCVGMSWAKFHEEFSNARKRLAMEETATKLEQK